MVSSVAEEVELIHDLKYTELAIVPTARGFRDIAASLEPEQRAAVFKGCLAFYFMFYVLLTLPVMIVSVLDMTKDKDSVSSETD